MIIVLNSGHMVPMDVPEVALDMLGKFLRGDSFVSGTSPLGSAVHAPVDVADCGGRGTGGAGGRAAGALSGDPRANSRAQASHRNSPGGGGSNGRSLRAVVEEDSNSLFQNDTFVTI